MKTDVLTIAALVFVVGLVLSSFDIAELFGSSEESDIQIALEQRAAQR